MKYNGKRSSKMIAREFLEATFKKGFNFMWTTVYMAQDKTTAESLRSRIEEKNIIVMLRCIRVPDKAVEDCYEILVPAAESEDALNIIIND